MPLQYVRVPFSTVVQEYYRTYMTGHLTDFSFDAVKNEVLIEVFLPDEKKEEKK